MFQWNPISSLDERGSHVKMVWIFTDDVLGAHAMLENKDRTTDRWQTQLAT